MDISDLVARFNRAADSGSADEIADTFTEDGVFEGPRSAARGRDEIRAYNLALEANPKSSRSLQARHLTANVVVELTSQDSARLVADLFMIVPGVSAPEISMMGGYEDELVRTLAGWRFKHRRVTVIQMRQASTSS